MIRSISVSSTEIVARKDGIPFTSSPRESSACPSVIPDSKPASRSTEWRTGYFGLTNELKVAIRSRVARPRALQPPGVAMLN